LGDGLITTPSDWPDIDLFNKKVIQLHSGGVVLGPSHLTRVSKSQKIEVTVESYYNNLENSVTTGQSLLQIFASMLVNILGQSQVLFPAESGAFLTTFSNGASPQSTAIADFLNSHGAELDADKPQSFLVYVFFDSKLMIDSRFSGVVQVGDPNLKKILEMNERSMPKEGYFYTYVTNQSSKKVYFNDLRIVRKDGIIKQENHYYPYGLTWSKIPNQEHRNSGFQGKDFQQGEWSEYGLDFYDFGARMFDPVIGRWVVPDPVAQHHNLYQSMAGNPISFVDPNGLSDGWIEDENGNVYWDENINSIQDFEEFGMFSSNFDGARAVKYLFQEGFGWIDGVHYYFSEIGGMSALNGAGGTRTLETVEIVDYKVQSPEWYSFNRFIDDVELSSDLMGPVGNGAYNILKNRGSYMPRHEIYRVNKPITVRTPFVNINTTSRVLNYTRLGGKVLGAANIVATGYEISQDWSEGKYKSAGARAAVYGLATGAAFIPVFGWGLAIGIGVADYLWGDDFYNWVEKQ
jgi:RHS repeat-associated protein